MALMTENRVRHLPVMVDGNLIGLISIGDLVKHIISEQKFVIEQLEHLHLRAAQLIASLCSDKDAAPHVDGSRRNVDTRQTRVSADLTN